MSIASQTTYGNGPSSNDLLAGQIPSYAGRGPVLMSLLNNSEAAQVETLQATSTSYAVTLTKGGVSRTFSGTGLANANASAAALKAAIEADGIASGWVSVSVATDTVTATALFSGSEHAVSYSGATNITLTETTAASDGASIEFGLAVMHDSTEGQGVRPTKTSAVAKVVHLTPAAVNSAIYYVGVELSDGRKIFASYTADGSATAQEIVEGLQPAIDALMPASTVVWTEDNAKLIATSEVAGVDFTAIYGSSNSTATWTHAIDTANVTSALTRPLAGIAVRSPSIPASPTYTGGDGTPASSYPSQSEMTVMEAGVIVGLTDDTVSRFDPVYVRCTATGSEKVGSFRNDSDSGDCILLAGARFIEAAAGTSSAHAPVKIQLELSTAT